MKKGLISQLMNYRTFTILAVTGLFLSLGVGIIYLFVWRFAHSFDVEQFWSGL